MNIQDIAVLLSGVKRTANGYAAKCPAHADSSPSLMLRENEGRVLVHCFAGCSFEEISNAVGLNMRDWFADTEPPADIRPASEYRKTEKQVYDFRNRMMWLRLDELGKELRRRDIERLRILALVDKGQMDESQALDLLDPIYRGYSEMEYEFQETLRKVNAE